MILLIYNLRAIVSHDCCARRLAKIRKVGLTAPHASKRAADSTSRAPWIPLPLRRRNPDGWS